MDPERSEDWSDEKEDNSLYNAMIWALSIGIVVVLVTLFLTRPAPEAFTELYFNNHQNLPKYVNLNEKYYYEFSIHNLENKQQQYNFTISTELYNFDLTCERPDLWLEGNTTRKTETDDPALYIREKIYAITFNYELLNSKYLIFKLDNKYEINITNDTLSFNNNKKIYQWKLNNTQPRHKITIYFDPEFTRIIHDGQEFYIFTDYEYTNGYPYFETEYAEITGFQIWRRNAKQNVNIKIADSTYTEIPLVKELDSGIVILYSRFLSSPLYDKIINQPIIRTEIKNQTLSYYYSEAPVNLTDYTLTVNARITTDSKIELGFDNDILITYQNNNLTINGNEYNKKGNNPKIKIDVNDNVEVFFNEEKITELNDTITGIPYIKAYNGATINSFIIKSKEYPLTINYKLPDKKVVTYSGIYNPAITSIYNETAGTVDEPERQARIRDLFDREKNSWNNYRITASYTDRIKKNDFTIKYATLDETIYSLSVGNGTAKIFVEGKNFSIPITTQTINLVSIDFNNGIITFYFNDVQLLKEKVREKQGLVLFDYPGIILSNAQIENKDSGAIKIYKRETNIECNPILINEYHYEATQTLENDQKLIFNAFFNITEPFDIAKVQVKLMNGQEIHYWVRKK